MIHNIFLVVSIVGILWFLLMGLINANLRHYVAAVWCGFMALAWAVVLGSLLVVQ